MMGPILVLDKGSIELVDSMGTDQRIVDAARISIGAKKKAKRTNEELIRHLMKEGHLSPLEHVHFTFSIKAPIFVMRQWMRHRTWNYCEVSRRYSADTVEVYVPDIDRWGTDLTKDPIESKDILNDMNQDQQFMIEGYQALLKAGLPRELARIFLPFGMYTEVMATVDLRNLFHFIELRQAPEAQFEIQEYAKAMLKLIEPIVPLAVKIWKEKPWAEEKSSSIEPKSELSFSEGQLPKQPESSGWEGLLSASSLKKMISDVVRETTHESIAHAVAEALSTSASWSIEEKPYLVPLELSQPTSGSPIQSFPSTSSAKEKEPDDSSTTLSPEQNPPILFETDDDDLYPWEP